ncbi:exonuclease SbcCD subunit D [Marinicrinis lubricantis]|uniref:Nuclease SbcCD subunit D n=1 Tax=Marinicrinis lubricantis TaxID=2086470 RepID=A0ABW1IUP9_9BACL
MRILHTADWHLGKTLEGRSRLPEQEDVLNEMVEIVKDDQIDLIVMAGDVYDTVNPPAAAEQLFYDSIVRLTQNGRIPIAVISGNHDSPDRLMASHPIAEKYGIHLYGLPRLEPLKLRVGRDEEEAIIIPFSYPSESRLKQALTAEADEGRLQKAYSAVIRSMMEQASKAFSAHSVNLIMSHLYTLGGAESDSERPVQVGGAYTVDPSAFDVGAHYTALGHLHRPQNVKGPSLVRYSGSPLAYSFSEAGQAKSVTIIEAAAGQPVRYEERFLRSGKPLVAWDAKNGLQQVYSWLEEGIDADAWIDLKIHLTDALTLEDIHKLRSLHSGIIHIRPIFPEMERQDAPGQRLALPLDELFRRFYSRQTGGGEASDELIRLFMELASRDEEDETALEGIG